MSRKLIYLISLVMVLGPAAGMAGGQEVMINFQPKETVTGIPIPVPAGYLPDYGEEFADRGNGYSYGWDANMVGSTRKRNIDLDERKDTLIETQPPGQGDMTWEVELPNGGYDVFLACGDPAYNDHISTHNVEGVIVDDPDGLDLFDEYYVTVIVNDGRLTIKPGPGALKCPIMFLHITRIKVFKASSPVPNNGAIHPDTWANLTWLPGDAAASHNVYFGDNFDDVNDGTADTFRGNQTDTSFIVGSPGYPYPEGLVPGTTYYWRIDEVNDLHPESPWKGDIWRFKVPIQSAYDPDPPDGAKFVELDVVLSWTAGFGAALHHIYFGTDEDAVSSATTASPEYKGYLTAESFDPDTVDKGKTYYWRVDQFDGVNMHKGDVWSFTTIPDIPITDPNLLCWWKFDEDSDSVAIDYSGYDHHGIIYGASLVLNGRVGAALNFGGDGDYVVDEDAEEYLNGLSALTVCMWIKSKMIRTDRGFINCEEPDGSDQMVTMRYDLSGSNYGGANVVKIAVTSTPDWEQQLESSSYVQTTEWQHVAMTWSSGDVIRFYVNGTEDTPTGTGEPNDAGGTVTGCTKLIVGKGGKDQGTTAGWNGLIDDVRIFNNALTEEEIKHAMRGETDIAWNPSPANGSTPDLQRAMPLSWSIGDWAIQHDVYFGTDEDAVADADASDTTGIYRGRQPATSYTPQEGVEWGGGPYYWRIDEYNTNGTISKGRVWSFTVAAFILVDDFENYNAGDNQIWYAWRDGLGYGIKHIPPYSPGNGTGSEVGDGSTLSYTEETIIHGGGQSMPYVYNNNKPDKMKYSEAKLTLNYPRDWTEEGVKALALWFRGNPAGFTEEPPGTYTMTASGIDIAGMTDEFRYAYKQLSGPGSIEAQVLSVENTHVWAKAGVMIRRTLDPSSPFAAVFITPGNGCRFQGRLALGVAATSDTFVATPEQRAIKAPYWVKLERDGSDNFYGYYSSDGVNWQAMRWNPQYISVPTDVYIGLALTSHNVNATCKAQFSGVKTTGSVSPTTWTVEAIGTTMVSNDAEPMYVAVANSTGTPAVVYHNNPNAAQIETWTQWNIDLKEFADKGVNLTDVNSIAIGFGDRNNPQAGGLGKMYFDDIRLYRPRYVPGKGTPLAADLNSDGVVNMADVEVMTADWLASGPDLTGDLNTDSSVDFKDYAVLANQWLEEQLWPEW